jgi:hypothetical protein
LLPGLFVGFDELIHNRLGMALHILLEEAEDDTASHSIHTGDFGRFDRRRLFLKPLQVFTMLSS